MCIAAARPRRSNASKLTPSPAKQASTVVNNDDDDGSEVMMMIDDSMLVLTVAIFWVL